MPRRLLTEKWEVEVVTCSMYLFQHADLEKLLGSLVYTVRTSRTAMTGEDRRGTKRELATCSPISFSRPIPFVVRLGFVRPFVASGAEIAPP